MWDKIKIRHLEKITGNEKNIVMDFRGFLLTVRIFEIRKNSI